MAKSAPKLVIFLDAGDGVRGQAAAAEFNSVAGRFGLPWVARSTPPDDAAAVVGTAGKVVALDRSAADAFPAAVPPVELWEVAGGPELKAAVARHVSGLVARLLGGRVVADSPAPAAPVKEPKKPLQTVRVGRETAGRRGKGVTTVFDLPLSADGLKDLAATLKQKCGTGGTVKDGRIEIQGDHRDRIVAELEQLGYRVKRAGG